MSNGHRYDCCTYCWSSESESIVLRSCLDAMLLITLQNRRGYSEYLDEVISLIVKVVGICLVIDHNRLLDVLMISYVVSVFSSKVENEMLCGVEVVDV